MPRYIYRPKVAKRFCRGRVALVMLEGKLDKSGFFSFCCPSLASLLSDSSWFRRAEPAAWHHSDIIENALIWN